jgi:TrmH family RNA methyltransferase
MPFPLLTSAQNPKIKDACHLRDRRHRETSGQTLLEGYRELSRAFEYGIRIDACFLCPALFLGENENPLLERIAETGALVFEVTEPILRKMAYRDLPEGLVAVARIPDHRLESLPCVSDGLYLVAESIEKPGNLGSMLRSADAAGADGLIVCDRKTDLYNPNVIRASTGALFAMPLAETDSDDAYNWMRRNHLRIIAASPHAETVYTDADLARGTAIVVGTEQYGLSEFWMEKADVQVRIPMLGKIDSLNVATAATLLLYEAARQRGWKRAT